MYTVNHFKDLSLDVIEQRKTYCQSRTCHFSPGPKAMPALSWVWGHVGNLLGRQRAKGDDWSNAKETLKRGKKNVRCPYLREPILAIQISPPPGLQASLIRGNRRAPRKPRKRSRERFLAATCVAWATEASFMAYVQAYVYVYVSVHVCSAYVYIYIYNIYIYILYHIYIY